MPKFTVKGVYAPGPNTERGKRTRITTSPDGESFVYASGNSIVIRNARDPMIADVYTGHNARTTCAAISPSGYYCASADIKGNIRIWDTTNKEEHPLKLEKKSFSGGVFDLGWTEDSKRVAAVGNGSDKKAEIFQYDTGTSSGELTGHTQACLSIAVKQKRPYLIITGGEDCLVNSYSSTPFKFNHSSRNHTRFVNDVEFAPNQEIYVSGGGDKKILFYSSKDGSILGEAVADSDSPNPLLGGAHKLSVFSLSFTRDGSNLFSCSADKTIKLWDVETRKYLSTFSLYSSSSTKDIDISDTPVGICCTNYSAVVSSLKGNLFFFDKRVEGGLPVSVVRNHNKSIESLNIIPHSFIESPSSSSSSSSSSSFSSSFITSSLDGQIIDYSLSSGPSSSSKGFLHSSFPSSASVWGKGNKICSLGLNDTISFSSPSPTPYPLIFPPSDKVTSSSSSSSDTLFSPNREGTTPTPISLPPPFPTLTLPLSQPKSVALLSDGEEVVVISDKLVSVYSIPPTTTPTTPSPLLFSLPLTYSPLSLSSHSQQSLVCIGGNDSYVHLYKWSKDDRKLVEIAKSKGKYSGPVSAVAISPSGKLFAAGRDRFLCVGPTSAEELNSSSPSLQEGRLLHTSKITTLDFSPSSDLLLSGGLDCQLFVWDVKDESKFTLYSPVHAPLGISQAKWVSDTAFLTTGPDAIIRYWSC